MTQMTDEERAYYERTRRSIIKAPQSRLGRIGCGIALIGWFALLLMPCALFYMAFAGQISEEIRLPLVPITEEAAAQLKKVIAEAGGTHREEDLDV